MGSESNMQGKKLKNFLEESAREGGKLALEHFGRVRAEPKGASIVSEADRAVERLLVSRIRDKFPTDYILAEESGANGSAHPRPKTRWWAIDPIDGTLTYLCRMPFWSISVACLRGGKVEGGAVFLPVLEEMYSAVADGRATRNGAVLSPLPGEPADSHSLIFVPSSRVEGLRITKPRLRLSVSAVSCHLLFAAAGSAFGVVVEPVRAYDIAAASLILERAGGALRYTSGGEVDFAPLADGRRMPEPAVGAAVGRVDWLRGQVSWEKE